MTDKQKREHISFLYRQLDTCGRPGEMDGRKEGGLIMGSKIIQPTGRGFCKQKQIDEEVQRMKEMAKESLLRRYENGYEDIIDKHPHGKTYRDPRNPSGIVALPQENIMLLTSTWSVVMFLDTIEDLNRIDCEMKLRRVL